MLIFARVVKRMIVNKIVTGFIAILIGYLLGSIPFAYLFTRLVSGKDVRKVSGGNVGARNAFRNIGKPAGIATAIFDIAKGAASGIGHSPLQSRRRRRRRRSHRGSA